VENHFKNKANSKQSGIIVGSTAVWKAGSRGLFHLLSGYFWIISQVPLQYLSSNSPLPSHADPFLQNVPLMWTLSVAVADGASMRQHPLDPPLTTQDKQVFPHKKQNFTRQSSFQFQTQK
jgi:hypothetical protein